MLLYERTKCEALHQEILFSGFVIYNPALFYKKMMRLLTKATRMASNRGICCLSSLGARWDLGRGNWIDLQPGNLLPFRLETKMPFWAKATGLASSRQICCLSSLRPRCDFGQRQLDRPPSGISAAFDTFEQDWVFSRGNQMGLRPAYLLPLTHSGKIGSSAEATKMAPDRQNCCL